MPERYARLAAFALIAILLVAFPLLISLFGTLAASTLAATPIALAPTATYAPATATPTVLPAAATADPSPLASPTASCPNPATPEPFWVNPLVSPTNELTQKISVTLGNGREIAIASESGTVTLKGQFTVNTPVEIEIPLLPDVTHNLAVTGKVEYASGCEYDLQTRTDRNGKPLVIVQLSGTPIANVVVVTSEPTSPNVIIVTPEAAAPPNVLIVTPEPNQPPPNTPPASGTVYLQPFVQVFAVGQSNPNPPGDVLLYQGAGDPLTILAQEQFTTRLQSADGQLSFWTLGAGVSQTPPPPTQFDASIASQPAALASNAVFACQDARSASPPLGQCSILHDVSNATFLGRAISNGSTTYLIEINGTPYWVSAATLTTAP